MTNLRTVFRSLAAMTLAVGLVAGCGSDDAGDASADDSGTGTAVSIVDPWSRQPAEGQTATAVYGTVVNDSGDDVTIVAASSPVTGTVELHETLSDDEGRMSMQEVPEGFVVPAGGEFSFEPGGPHVMLLGIDPTGYPAEVEVTFEIEGAGSLTFTAEVRAVDGSMDHEDMDMDDDTEMDVDQ